MRKSFFAFVVLVAAIAPLAVAGEISLTVRNPDGSPAAGTQAVLAPVGRYVSVTKRTAVDDDAAYIRKTVGADGIVRFPAQARGYTVLLLSETGSAEVRGTAKGPEAAEATLAAWGRVEGDLVTKPVGEQEMLLSVKREPDEAFPTISYEGETKTDAQGHFAFEGLPPGKVKISRVNRLMLPMQGNQRFMQVIRTQHVYASLKSGEVTKVSIGGTGRLVTGAIALPEGCKREDMHLLFSAMRPVVPVASRPNPMPVEMREKPLPEQVAWWEAFNRSPAARVHRMELDKSYENVSYRERFLQCGADGRFQVEDVEPGEYDLKYEVFEFSNDKVKGDYLLQQKITVPAGEGAFDVGTLSLSSCLAKGEVAADFDVPGMDGKPVRLSDYRGKFVLLDFWATWCGPCVAEMPNLKKVYERFGSDPRFVMLGLSADMSPDKLASYLKKNDIRWRQGFLGFEDKAVQRSYSVTGIPQMILIGPDGRVVEPGMRGEGIEKAVEKALSSAGK